MRDLLDAVGRYPVTICWLILISYVVSLVVLWELPP